MKGYVYKKLSSSVSCQKLSASQIGNFHLTIYFLNLHGGVSCNFLCCQLFKYILNKNCPNNWQLTTSVERCFKASTFQSCSLLLTTDYKERIIKFFSLLFPWRKCCTHSTHTKPVPNPEKIVNKGPTRYYIWNKIFGLVFRSWSTTKSLQVALRNGTCSMKLQDKATILLPFLVWFLFITYNKISFCCRKSSRYLNHKEQSMALRDNQSLPGEFESVLPPLFVAVQDYFVQPYNDFRKAWPWIVLRTPALLN